MVFVVGDEAICVCCNCECVWVFISFLTLTWLLSILIADLLWVRFRFIQFSRFVAVWPVVVVVVASLHFSSSFVHFLFCMLRCDAFSLFVCLIFSLMFLCLLCVFIISFAVWLVFQFFVCKTIEFCEFRVQSCYFYDFLFMANQKTRCSVPLLLFFFCSIYQKDGIGIKLPC